MMRYDKLKIVSARLFIGITCSLLFNVSLIIHYRLFSTPLNSQDNLEVS